VTYRDEQFAAKERIAHLEAALEDVERRIASVPRPKRSSRRLVWMIGIALLSVPLTSCMTAILANGSMVEQCDLK
jgi:hypothetical protein